MSCKMCEMKDGIEVRELEKDSHVDVCIYKEKNNKKQTLSLVGDFLDIDVPIKHCPWCGNKLNKNPRKKRKQYVYDFYEDGKAIARGTAENIVEEVGLRPSTIAQMSSDSYYSKIDMSTQRHSKKVGTTK